MGRGEATVYVVLVWIEWQLSASYFSCWTAPFMVLWLERATFSLGFCYFLLFLLTFLSCSTPQLQVWDVWSKPVISRVLSSQTSLPSLQCTEYSCVCFVNLVQGFYLYLVGGIGKSLTFFIYKHKPRPTQSCSFSKRSKKSRAFLCETPQVFLFCFFLS